jgi:CrcB protein
VTHQAAASDQPLTRSSTESIAAMLAVGGGGVVGALARWRLGEEISARWSSDFPWGTFIVNITGCFILGWYLGFAARQTRAQPLVHLAIATGLVGAYTTFSAFAYETVRLLQHGHILTGAGYVIASLAVGLLAAAAGLRLARGA